MSEKVKRSVSALAGLTLVGAAAVGAAPSVSAHPGKGRDSRPPTVARQACNVKTKSNATPEAKKELALSLKSAANTYAKNVKDAHESANTVVKVAKKKYREALRAAKDDAARELAKTVFEDAVLSSDAVYWANVDKYAAEYEKSYDMAYATYYASTASAEYTAAWKTCRTKVAEAGTLFRAEVASARSDFLKTTMKLRAEYRAAAKKKSSEENKAARKIFRKGIAEAQQTMQSSVSVSRKKFDTSIKAATAELKSSVEQKPEAAQRTVFVSL